MKKSITIFLLINYLFVFSQEFIKINAEKFTLEEFENTNKIGLKEIPAEKLINEFISFELLKQFAYKQNLEKLNAYEIQYNNEIFKLKDSLFYPKDFLNNLIKKQINRSSYERKAQFIVLNNTFETKENNKIQLEDIKNKIINGKIDFEGASKKHSNYTQNSKYYSTFELDAYLEDLVFETKIGEISPVYQNDKFSVIVKVFSERPALGELLISQLVINGKENLSLIQTIKQEIDSKQITFEDAVKKYSTDENSKKFNGMLAPITNAVRDDLYDVFSKLQFNQISNPVEYEGNWYLYKLDGNLKFNTDTKENRQKVKQLLENTSFIEVLQKQAVENVEKHTNYKLNEIGRKKLLQSNVDKNQNEINQIAYQDFFSIDEYKITFKNVSDSLTKLSNVVTSRNELVYLSDKILDLELNKELMIYYSNHFDEMPHLVNDVKKIRKKLAIEYLYDDFFDKLARDENKQKEFYTKNSKNFVSPDLAETIIYDCANEETANEIEKLLLKKETTNKIKSLYVGKKTTDGNLLLFIKKGNFLENSEHFPNHTQFKVGVQKLAHNNRVAIVQITQIIKKRQKLFVDSVAEIIPQLKSKLIEEKKQELLKNAKIEIDQKQLQKLKEKYRN